MARVEYMDGAGGDADVDELRSPRIEHLPLPVLSALTGVMFLSATIDGWPDQGLLGGSWWLRLVSAVAGGSLVAYGGFLGRRFVKSSVLVRVDPQAFRFGPEFGSEGIRVVVRGEVARIVSRRPNPAILVFEGPHGEERHVFDTALTDWRSLEAALARHGWPPIKVRDPDELRANRNDYLAMGVIYAAAGGLCAVPPFVVVGIGIAPPVVLLPLLPFVVIGLWLVRFCIRRCKTVGSPMVVTIDRHAVRFGPEWKTPCWVSREEAAVIHHGFSTWPRRIFRTADGRHLGVLDLSGLDAKALDRALARHGWPKVEPATFSVRPQ